MNVEDLWIGDRLHIKSINETGTFEGITKMGLLKIKLNIGEVMVSSDEVTLMQDEEKPVEVITAKDKDPVKQKTSYKNEIDLHLEVLKPQLQKSEFKNVLSYQIAECRKFIQQAIQQKIPYVTIIHGKGEGILREAIEQLLEEFKNYIFTKEPANKGGAMLVYFN